MLLLLLLVAVQAAPEVQPEYGLASYLRIAAAYRTANHAAALQEIREWPPAVRRAAVSDLRGRSRQLRSVPAAPGDIAFGTVEAAVLMHAEAGLRSLEASDLAEAANHLGASVALYQWSRDAAVTAAPEIQPRIASRDFSLALAAAALAAGSPTTARPFAEQARRVAPFDPQVQLVYGCVAEGLAGEQLLRNRESAATAWRDRARLSLLDAVSLDAGLLEARLHIGKLHLDRGRLGQAERRLAEVDARSGDARQRYLARLLLGRVTERQGRQDEAVAFYRRALEAWPDSQAARLALAHAVEKSSGPEASLPLVAASLAVAQRLEQTTDPWRLYLFGPPGVADAVFARLVAEALDR